MPFVRTVLGDVEAADLGITYAHEHLVIAGGPLVDRDADFRLDSVGEAVAELAPARTLGLRTVVDAMPADLGRDVRKLAEVSRRSDVRVVAATGAHVAEHYLPGHWSLLDDEDALAHRFIAEIEVGVEEPVEPGDTATPTRHRTGVIKVGGSRDRLSERDRRVFRAAAAAQRATGCPILTHCTDGTAGPEQVAVLAGAGADLGHVVLSHVDKVVDRGYHRELLSTGVSLEYDQAFRWKAGGSNGTLTLLGWLVDDGLADRLVLGLDAARRSYWTVHGGRPGWAFLLDDFSLAMDAHGLDSTVRRRLFVENPARVYAFIRRGEGLMDDPGRAEGAPP